MKPYEVPKVLQVPEVPEVPEVIVSAAQPALLS
jgi:hypothetical protein